MVSNGIEPERSGCEHDRWFRRKHCTILNTVKFLSSLFAQRRESMVDAKEILATAIEMEHFGSEYYSKFKDLVASEKAKTLLRSLAADEKDHAHILEIELSNLGGRLKPPAKEKLKKSLKQVFPERIHKNSIHAKDAISAIKLGILTERRSIEFYTKHAAKASPKMRKIFAKLIRMEIVHLGLLEENLQLLEDDGSWYGYLPILEG